MAETFSPNAEPVRTAVVGYGLAGRVFHSPFISASPLFSLDYVATSDPTRVAQVHAEHPGARVVANAEELATHFDELDLLVLASPPSVHLQQGLAALDAGLAVLVDKPFAPSVADALSLIEKAEAVNRPLIVFQNRRWDGDFMTVRSIIESGELGEVYQFESAFEHWAPEVTGRWQDETPVADGGGVSFDLGSHLIDQALLLFGPVSDVRADLRTVRKGGGNDDVAFIELLHDTGVRSRLLMNRVSGQPGPRFRVLGTRGAFVSYGLDGQEPALASGMKPDDERFGVEPEESWGTIGVSAPGNPKPVKIPTIRGDYRGFYERIAQAVRGKAPVPVPPREALEVLKLIVRAHETSRPIIAI